MTFSASFFVVLVSGGLTLTAVGATVLVVLLIRDWKGGALW